MRVRVPPPAPIITDDGTVHHGQNRIEGVLFDRDNQETILEIGDYELTIRHSYTLGYEAESRNEEWGDAGAILIQTGDNEFYLAGSGIVATFRHISQPSLNVGILKADEGRFEDNEWKVIRHLNGDQIHQGRHIRILLGNFSIQRFELYHYE